jgi:hypothetical protein
MSMGRRDLLVASGLFLPGGTRVAGRGAEPSPARPQTRGPQETLLEALRKNRLPLTMSDEP